MTVTKPGIYPEISAREYFEGQTKARCLTSSAIKTLLNETPADLVGKEDTDSHAKRMGDVSHQLALDKGKGYALSPYDRWQSDDAKDWKKQAEAQGLTPIKKPDLDIAMALAVIIKDRIKAAVGDNAYATEVPFYWVEETQYGKVWCSGMLDVWCHDLALALDPKITKVIHGDKARAHIANMGWHTQNAWYRRGLAKLFPDMAGILQFKNLLISPDKPHSSRLIQISEGWRQGAELDCERALMMFARCQSTGEWPGYPAEETLDEPTWAMSQRLNREIEEESGGE